MGRPGFPVANWTDLEIGEVVMFFTGAGWNKATVQSRSERSLQILFTHGSKEKRITVTDTRNVRRKDPKVGNELQQQRIADAQQSLFGS
jgi:hypothetical protein